MMKVIFEDRVIHDVETAFFNNAEDAYYHLYAKLAGTPKVVSVEHDEAGAEHFVIHNYIVRGQENVVFLEKRYAL